MKIGDRLKKLRLDRNMTLEEVGAKIGASKQTLYKYENGIVTNIPSDKIEALADIYGVNPWDIMGWEGPKKQVQLSESQQRFIDAFTSMSESDDPKERAVADAIKHLLKVHEQETDGE